MTTNLKRYLVIDWWRWSDRIKMGLRCCRWL